MRVPGLWRLRRAAGRVRKQFSRRALVLLYHRVAEADSDPWSLCVTPRHFAEHMEVLRRRGDAVPLRRLALALRDGSLPRRAVAVTFDDGYADNLLEAKPVLERYGVPATVFVATGYVGHEREFWWDALDGLFLQPGRLPEVLDLTLNGSTYRWELGEAAEYDEATRDRFRSWRAWTDGPSPRHAAYRDVWELLHPMPEGERRKVQAELLAWAGLEPKVRHTHRTLSAAEVRELASGGLVEVGAHTVSHSALSGLPPEAQREEILASRSRLEEILGREVDTFAYPYGQPRDYTDETAAIVREAGFACACSTSPELVRPWSDRFRLPRFGVEDFGGDVLARKLDEWFSE
jgi:peptidoglycan/xylan/chitin deacetylase (PgdA/CDA1 family)